MLVRLRREYAQLVTSGAQLFLLLLGFKLGTRIGWLFSLGLMAAISLMAWLSSLNRLRAVRDTPTSKVASAAQGYVELQGYGQHFAGSPLLSKLSAIPCLWFRYRVEERSDNNKWKVIDGGESSDSFVLRDDTGLCIVDPEQAEIYTKHRSQWSDAGYRYTEWNLFPNDSLYAIGEFRTQGGSSVEFNTREELNTLLAEWKKDMPALLKRFDLDNNGTLDLQEWMLARQAAKREVAKRMQEAQAAPDIHLMSKPRDGRLFLISSLDPYDLARRYMLWSWAHLLVFIAALIALSWLIKS